MIRKLALQAVFLATPAFAQPPAPPTPRPAPVWQMDWGDFYCTLVRLPDAGTRFVVAFREVPGNFMASMRLMRHEGAAPPRSIDRVVLLPGGRYFDVESRQDVASAADIIEVGGLPEEFWLAFATSTAIQLHRRDAVQAEIPLSRASGAATSFRNCLSNGMREWGVDEAAWRALSRRPATTNGYGLRSADYPPQALMRGQQGRLVIRLTISAEGRASECTVAQTSGNRAFDDAVCPAITRRGRFTIPLDAQGRPTSARSATAVTWIIRR